VRGCTARAQSSRTSALICVAFLPRKNRGRWFWGAPFVYIVYRFARRVIQCERDKNTSNGKYLELLILGVRGWGGVGGGPRELFCKDTSNGKNLELHILGWGVRGGTAKAVTYIGGERGWGGVPGRAILFAKNMSRRVRVCNTILLLLDKIPLFILFISTGYVI